MPNDFAIRPATSPAPRVSAPVPDTPAAVPVPAGDALPNPTMRLDPALGLVVIEFHNNAGEVTTSLPGARQLDAYRTARDLNIAPEIIPGIHLSATHKA